MATPRPTDLLVHVGGDALVRYGTAQRRRWRREVNLLTCIRGGPALGIGRDGLYHVFGVDTLRMQNTDADGDGVRERIGFWSEHTRINRMIKQNDFTSANGWFHVGTPVVTSAYLSVGAVSLSKIQDDDGAASEYVGLNYVSFTDKPWPVGDGNGTKPYSILWTKSDTEAPQGVGINITDTTAAGATRFAATLKADGAGAPVVSGVTGTYLGAEFIGLVGTRKIYRLYFMTTTITAGNEHVFRILPSNGSVADTGDAIVGMIQAEDIGAFPSSLIWPVSTTTAITRSAEDILVTLPGVTPVADLSILAEFARPIWADLAGDIVIAPGVASIGTTGSGQPCLNLNCNSGDRSVATAIRDAQITGSGNASLPAGAILSVAGQFRQISTAAKCRAAAGGAWSSESAAHPLAIPKYGAQSMMVGGRFGNGAHRLFGVMHNVALFRGLFEQIDMEAY